MLPGRSSRLTCFLDTISGRDGGRTFFRYGAALIPYHGNLTGCRPKKRARSACPLLVLVLTNPYCAMFCAGMALKTVPSTVPNNEKLTTASLEVTFT
jgi:hypothetical protein